MTPEEIKEYILSRYGAEPEYLWPDYPDTFIFRHEGSRKWFAIVMEVQRAKIGLPGEGTARLMNVKCGPLLGGSFIGSPGVVPAWHMNKKNWIGLVLDGEAGEETVKELLEISFDMTGGTKATPRKFRHTSC